MKKLKKKMPIFPKKKNKEAQPPPSQGNATNSLDEMVSANGSAAAGGGESTPAPPQNAQDTNRRTKLQFYCQLAQGSPTGIISGFTNVKELYKKIADCFNIEVAQILFCTLNTHKIDMSRLLGGQIGLDDFIFAHCKGQNKEVEVTKTEDALGLTITDNGAGYAFIKRIKEGSTMSKVNLVEVGDHIEKIKDKSVVGCRHFEVAKMLKEIGKGETFLVRLVQPNKDGFTQVAASSSRKGGSGVGTGKETLRLRATAPSGLAVVENDEIVKMNAAVRKLNELMESFLGINDSELAEQVWDIAGKLSNPVDFVCALEDSDMKDFQEYGQDFLFDLYGAVKDAKENRLPPEYYQEEGQQKRF